MSFLTPTLTLFYRHRRFREHSAIEEESDKADNDTDWGGSDVDCCLCGLCDKAREGEREEKELLETSLDEEMREALVSTPADPNPSPSPRCEIVVDRRPPIGVIRSVLLRVRVRVIRHIYPNLVLLSDI